MCNRKFAARIQTIQMRDMPVQWLGFFKVFIPLKQLAFRTNFQRVQFTNLLLQHSPEGRIST